MEIPEGAHAAALSQGHRAALCNVAPFQHLIRSGHGAQIWNVLQLGEVPVHSPKGNGRVIGSGYDDPSLACSVRWAGLGEGISHPALINLFKHHGGHRHQPSVMSEPVHMQTWSPKSSVKDLMFDASALSRVLQCFRRNESFKSYIFDGDESFVPTGCLV